jgi:outer membrane efflux family protein
LQRPDILRAEHELQAAKWDVEAARRAFLPSLNLSATLGLDAFSPKYLLRLPESVAFGVLGGLTAPLINKKAIQTNFDQANAMQLEALYNYDKALLTAYSDMSTLQSRAHNLSQYQALKNKQVQSLTRAVTTAQQLYAYNRATYLEVLDSEREQLDCQTELIDTQLQQISTLIDAYRGFFY